MKNMNYKIEKSLDILRVNEDTALELSGYGYHVGFSGGKDSQVVYELCRMADVEFKAFFYRTSVDPKELLIHIRSNYPNVEWVRPKRTMFQLIYDKGFLPYRTRRYCCSVLKEQNGGNCVVVTGIRAEESVARSKRKAIEISTGDQTKLFVHPILNWTRNEVLEFLSDRNIPLCSLYETQDRIGCVGCPMAPKSMRRDFRNMPNFKKAYINTVQKLMNDKGRFSEFSSAEEVVDWWASGKSKDKWFADKLQYKLNFKKGKK